MPFSIIPKLPQIIKAIKLEGYLDIVPLPVLRKKIKIITGVYTDKSVSNVIENLIELDYLEEKLGGFKIKKSYEKTKEKTEAPEKEADELLNKF